MLTILEDIRTEAEKLWQAGIAEAESILKKAEEAIGMHKAATEGIMDVSEIEVEDDKPAGYPPITPS